MLKLKKTTSSHNLNNKYKEPNKMISGFNYIFFSNKISTQCYKMFLIKWPLIFSFKGLTF